MGLRELPWPVAPRVGVLSRAPKGGGFDPQQGVCLGCGFNPWLGHKREATHRRLSVSHIDVCLPPSLRPVNVSLGEDGKGNPMAEMHHFITVITYI